MWLTWWLRCVLLCPSFLHMWFSEKEHHLQEEKSFQMQTIWEYRSLCFEKLLQYVEASPAWHAEDIAPLPESEFSLSCPVTGTSFGGQAALGAHSQMGSRWNFSPFMLDFTTDQAPYSRNTGLLFSSPQQQLASVSVRGKNCPLLARPRCQDRCTAQTVDSSCRNFELQGLQMKTLECMEIFFLAFDNSFKERRVRCVFVQEK